MKHGVAGQIVVNLTTFTVISRAGAVRVARYRGVIATFIFSNMCRYAGQRGMRGLLGADGGHMHEIALSSLLVRVYDLDLPKDFQKQEKSRKRKFRIHFPGQALGGQKLDLPPLPATTYLYTCSVNHRRERVTRSAEEVESLARDRRQRGGGSS